MNDFYKMINIGDLMNNMYAVKSLFESSASPNVYSDKIFEERIIVVKAQNEGEIKAIMYQQFPPDTYENSAGGYTTIQLVKILDVFEIVDHVGDSLHLKEVYSRYLLFEEGVTVEEVIDRYQLDK